MFQQIAAEELEHYERLKQLAEIWASSRMARDHSPKSERDNSFHDSQGYGKKSIQFTQGG